MMALYAVLYYAQHRKPIYWQYALYIGCMVIAFQLDDADYRKTTYAPGADYWVVFIESLAFILYIRFAILLMDVARHDALSYRLMQLMIGWILVGLVLDTGLWLLHITDQTRSMLYTLNRFALAGVALVVVPRLIRLRQAVITYFIVGSFFFVTGCIIALCINFMPHVFTRNPADPFTYPVTLMELGVIAEVLCFNLGMSLRNRQTEQEKIAVQSQLIEQLQENERKQQKLQRIRQEIARDLHDDLGADLSGISMLSSAAANQVISRPEEAKANLRLIGQTAKRVITGMREIIWSLNATHSSVENTLFRLRETAYTLFEHHPTELYLDLADDIAEEDIPPESRRELFLMFKEILHNVVRHAQAQQVHIKIEVNNDMLCLMVRDNGVGFDISANQQTGNGLTSLYQRAESINGQLRILSEPGQGTTVSFCGPVIKRVATKADVRPVSWNRPV